jgi:hypothetical protein
MGESSKDALRVGFERDSNISDSNESDYKSNERSKDCFLQPASYTSA